MNSDDLINNVRPIYLSKTTTVRGYYSKISNEKCQSLIRLVYEQEKSILEPSEMLQVNYSSERGKVNKYEKFKVNNLEVQGGSTRTNLTEGVANKI